MASALDFPRRMNRKTGVKMWDVLFFIEDRNNDS
jgi:hypothetical protein